MAARASAPLFRFRVPPLMVTEPPLPEPPPMAARSPLAETVR